MFKFKLYTFSPVFQRIKLSPEKQLRVDQNIVIFHGFFLNALLMNLESIKI